MKKIYLMFVFFCTLGNVLVIAQQFQNHGDIQIQWGELQRFRGHVEKIGKIQGPNFAIAVDQNSFWNTILPGFFPHSRRTITKRMNNLAVAETKRFVLRGNGKRSRMEGVADVGDDWIIFSSRSGFFSARTQIFYHRIGLFDFQTDANGVQLTEYFNSTGRKGRAVLSSSENFSRLGGLFTIPVQQHEFPGVGYALFDQQNPTPIAQNVVVFPYRQNQLEIYDQFVCNDGNYYVMGKEFYPINMNFPISPTNRTFAQVRLFHVVNDQFQEIDIQQNNTMVQEVKLNKDADGMLICTGLYAENLSSGLRGVFYMKINPETEEVLLQKRIPFTAEFLTSANAAWERNWSERFFAGQNRDTGLDLVKMHAVQPTKDGGIIAIAENQNIMYVPRNLNAENVRFDMVYYFDDVIVYKLDANGNLEWVRRVPKNQESRNDEGYGLSIAHAITDNNVYFFYNDNARNYDDLGNFIPTGRLFNGTPRVIGNVIGSVVINNQTGEVSRTMLSGRSDLKAHFLPLKSRVDQENNVMILYANRNRNHRFARIELR